MGGRQLALVVVSLAAVWPDSAEAIPAFARKYTAPCNLCHAPAYPVLNTFGRRFKENGYQLDAPGEEPARRESVLRPDPEQRLEILAEPPLSLRALSHLLVRPNARDAGGNGSELRPFETFYLLAGASLYPNVSLFAAVTLGPESAIHHAALGFHNLLSPEGHLNVRVGRLLLLDFSRPQHRFLTGTGNPIATTAVGLDPTVLDSTQHGVEIFGRLLHRRLFYRLGVVQGAQGPDGISDLDGHKDVVGELQLTVLSRITVGALGHLGRTRIEDETRGLVVRFTNRRRALAGFFELGLPLLNLFGQATHVSHDDPWGTGEHADYHGFRLEAQAPLGPRLYLIGRYDQVGSHHLIDQRRKDATVHLGMLVLTNLRLGLESAIPLRAIEGSALALRLDVAL